MKATTPLLLLASLLSLFACGGSAPREGAPPAPPEGAPPEASRPEAVLDPPQSTEAEQVDGDLPGLHGVVAPEGVTAEDPEELLAASLEALAARTEHSVPEIEVQHILVGVTHPSLAGVKRTVDEARVLTESLLARAAQGEDFGALVKEATNDAYPGIYGIALNGPGDASKQIYPRRQMVAAFGNVGWRLEVGEIGVAAHHPQDSYYGFHIVKRTK